MNKSIKVMTHVVIGYPSIEETIALVKTMVQAGADIVELQIPFSDPLADGPTIMKACEKSLENGTKVKDAFEIMKKLTDYFNRHSGKSKAHPESQNAPRDAGQASMTGNKSIPLLFMCYYNTVFKYGIEKFIKDAKHAGASGLIVPDMPIDEEDQEHFYEFCKKYDIPAIHVVSPASTDARLQKNAQNAQGFVYVTARQGITGKRTTLSSDLYTFLKKIKNCFAVPVAVGFGISSREQIQALKGQADIAIVGSAIIDIINKSDEETMLENISDFIKEILDKPE